MTEFEDVYNQYFKDVYKFTFSLCRNECLAEEITQETFFKALKSIDCFNGSCKMLVWLCQIAKNLLYTHERKEKRLVDEEKLDNESSDFSLEQNLLKSESAFEIHKHLHNLDEPYKEVFSLRLFGELSFYQIGQLFGKTESWARVTYHRAKLKLKEEVKCK